MYRDGSIAKYLDDASAGIPAPGGGSVSAFAGALAVTMGRMAANFTVGKRKFKAVEPQVREILNRLKGLGAELLEYVDEDVEAYGVVSAAYGMPRETDAEKSARTAKIQEALVVAMAVPLATVRACVEVMRQLAALVDLANPNLISDVGVSAVLTEAALRGAKLNVDINLAFLKDETLVKGTRDEVNALATEAARILGEVTGKVEAKIGS
ncbi:MAG TPA: cyclodeaminase/cyclohydrolase family protein [Planctomycetota bacterium]|nr:cyclodeaminase/cyclohydrolase family protein [Planctomycetota bacterium]